MSGEICSICAQHLIYHPEYKAYLPPTLREYEEGKDPKTQKRRWVLYH
jgi:hypothetical protein